MRSTVSIFQSKYQTIIKFDHKYFLQQAFCRDAEAFSEAFEVHLKDLLKAFSLVYYDKDYAYLLISRLMI